MSLPPCLWLSLGSIRLREIGFRDKHNRVNHNDRADNVIWKRNIYSREVLSGPIDTASDVRPSQALWTRRPWESPSKLSVQKTIITVSQFAKLCGPIVSPSEGESSACFCRSKPITFPRPSTAIPCSAAIPRSVGTFWDCP